MLLKHELIEELNKLPEGCMIQFGIFDKSGDRVEFLNLGRVDGKYIQPMTNSLVVNNPIVGYIITLAPKAE